MKYIMMETAAGAKYPIMFPEHLNHDTMAELIRGAIAANMGGTQAAVVSAGSVTLDAMPIVYGRSASLKLDNGGEADAARMVIGESVTLMPDEMVVTTCRIALRQRNG